MSLIDARGMACPQPVLMAKKATSSKPSKVQLVVDSTVARNNVEKFLKSAGYSVTVQEDSDDFLLNGVLK